MSARVEKVKTESSSEVERTLQRFLYKALEDKARGVGDRNYQMCIDQVNACYQDLPPPPAQPQPSANLPPLSLSQQKQQGVNSVGVAVVGVVGVVAAPFHAQKDAQLCRWFTALSACVSLLAKPSEKRSSTSSNSHSNSNSNININQNTPYQGLINTVFAYNLRGSVNTVRELCIFLRALVSANNVFAAAVFRLLLSAFILPIEAFQNGSSNISSGGSNDENKENPKLKLEKNNSSNSNNNNNNNNLSSLAMLEEIHDVVHQSLQSILPTVPLALTLFTKTMADLFPHKSKDISLHQLYIKNLLRVSEYVPPVRVGVLTLIIEKLVHMDVEIPFASINSPLPPKLTPIVDGYEKKLDQLMVLMFDYLSLLRSHGHGLDDEVFRALLEVFERSILKTHRSRFTQFLLFYFCSFKHVYAETFLQILLRKNFNPELPEGERVSCAAYIAGFVGRGAFLRHPTVVTTFEVLLNWLHAYDQFHQGSQGRGVRVGVVSAADHTHYYAVAQAVMVIAMHRRLLLADLIRRDYKRLEKFRLESLFASPLNPARYCLPRVVSSFALISPSLFALDITPILAENQKLHHHHNRQSEGNKSEVAVSLHQFPFDPFTLPDSSKYIDATIYCNDSIGSTTTSTQDSKTSLQIATALGIHTNTHAPSPLLPAASHHQKHQPSPLANPLAGWRSPSLSSSSSSTDHFQLHQQQHQQQPQKIQQQQHHQNQHHNNNMYNNNVSKYGSPNIFPTTTDERGGRGGGGGDDDEQDLEDIQLDDSPVIRPVKSAPMAIPLHHLSTLSPVLGASPRGMSAEAMSLSFRELSFDPDRHDHDHDLPHLSSHARQSYHNRSEGSSPS